MLLGAGLLVAGCGGPERPTISSADNTSEEDAQKKRLVEILDGRAKALQAKDEAAFLADLDQSNDKLIEQEKALFANLRQFKFKQFRYLSNKAMLPDIVEGGSEFGPIIQIAQLDVDDGPGGVAPGETYKYRLVRKDGKLVVGGITGANLSNASDGAMSGPLADSPWHFGPLKVIQAGNVWLAADRTVSDLDRYAAVAEREARWVEALWGDRTRFPGHVLFFTKDAENLKKWFSVGASDKGEDFIETILGFQHRTDGVRKDGSVYKGQYAGARIAVNLGNILRSKEDPARTVRHELAHAVTSRATVVTSIGALFGAPTWAVEGFASWTEGVDNAGNRASVRSEVARGVAAGKFKGRTPDQTEFYGKDISFNYALGSTVFRYAEQTKGRDAAVEFYARIIEHIEGSGFTATPAFDGICQRVLGMSGGAFMERWAGFVRRGA
ncbi:hypothetical protein GCM10022225_80360 [Plantactinospora mayteni]|uniref:Uncharacterized protein n=1 Tax=Plantactinospora mayteni TaxID=566021 RepID=A0ABQ4F3B2_9ACTN|nr:hypothetical protein [Plantactinospora mayteni]GIH01385.1 hypothetical protein Pma05_79570 [Plantactinospora mayteni]